MPAAERGNYFFSQHKVVDSKLIKYKEKKRGWNRVNLVYGNVELDGLTGPPDW